MLYDIFVYPIEIVLKLIFETCYAYTDSYLLAAFMLSIVVNIILLPFYYWAEKMQEREREITNELKPSIDEFKSVYKGWKLHAVISTLYRQHHYHPIYSLRSIMGLLVQVPFFIAAYHFLSTYQPIAGVETWLFEDLGAPDGWLSIGGFHINIMPFIMTAVNLLSGFVYAKNMTNNEKNQILILSLIFLILLYNSPALLLFYWTMNNVFSLSKNIIEKELKWGPLFSKMQIHPKENYDISTYEYFSNIYRKVKSSVVNYIKMLPLVEIALSVTLLYLYLLEITHIAPEGINQSFSATLQELIGYLAVAFMLLVAFSSLVFEKIKSYHFHHMERNKISDFVLILLPLSPIVQYVLLNQDTLSSYDSMHIIAVAATTAIMVVISIPVILSITGSRIVLMSLGLALIFLLFYMPTLALDNSWHKTGNFEIQLLVFIAILFGSILLYRINDKFFKIAIIVFFFSNMLMTLSSGRAKETIVYKKNNPFVMMMMDKAMVTKPDIYLLTYDAYVGNETMLQYGIDNSAQENYLESKGFKIYDKTYSLGSATWSTMTRILNMSWIHPGMHRQTIAGKSNVHRILRSHSYVLGSVMPGTDFWEKKIPLLDFYFPKDVDDGYEIVFNSILEGEFRFDAPKTFSEVLFSDFIKKKREFMSSPVHPKFMYTHTGPNHSQNSGKCLPNETELYENRLKKSNIEMKEDIETILKNNPDALIIVNGDHGPYLTGNCAGLGSVMSKDEVTRLHMQDRYGTFLAIKWPKSLVPIDDNLTVIQDVFLAVFSTLFGDETIYKYHKVPATTTDSTTAGVKIENGIIRGGINNGEPLFPDKEK